MDEIYFSAEAFKQIARDRDLLKPIFNPFMSRIKYLKKNYNKYGANFLCSCLNLSLPACPTLKHSRNEHLGADANDKVG